MSKIMKKRRMVLLFGIIIALIVPTAGVQAADVQAKPTNSGVIVNESKVAFEAYNIMATTTSNFVTWQRL